MEPMDTFHTIDKCNICGFTGHKTENHRCAVCGKVGIHSAKIHCKKCGSLDHDIGSHCSTHNQCQIIGQHTHSCKYCLGIHTTDEHICEFIECKQKGHSSIYHNIECVCNKCQVKGHLESYLHYKCNNCNSTILYQGHIKCETCGGCQSNAVSSYK